MIPGFGAAVRHDTYCLALAKVITDPVQEMREYIRRDILNLALRNTNNHGRNTAVLRTNDQVKLSPLFDFAPMFLDPADIGRVSRWEDEQPGNQPEWAVICEKFKNLLVPVETRTWLSDLGEGNIICQSHIENLFQIIVHTTPSFCKRKFTRSKASRSICMRSSSSDISSKAVTNFGPVCSSLAKFLASFLSPSWIRLFST
jgi:hypothetical protein